MLEAKEGAQANAPFEKESQKYIAKLLADMNRTRVILEVALTNLAETNPELAAQLAVQASETMRGWASKAEVTVYKAAPQAFLADPESFVLNESP
jgi:hypothetical protein